MSGGGSKDTSGQRANEDRKRKEAAITDVNRIFGIQQKEGLPAGEGKGGPTNNANNAKNAEAIKNNAALEKLYAGNRDTVFDFNKTKLDKDLGGSKRELGFTLARSGLFGGSEDIRNKQIQNETHDKGILESKNMADQSASEFRGKDEATRLDIINQIQSGVDGSTAMQNALRGLQLNASGANASANGRVIGNLFDDAGLIYTKDQQSRGITDARVDPYRSPTGAYFSNNTAYSGTKR